MDFVLGIVVMVALVAAGLYYGKWANDKRRADTWTGTVENKKISNVYDSDGDKTGVSYDLTIRRSDGKKKKLSVAKTTYDALNIGDTIEKKAGEMDPAKAVA